MLCCSIDTDSVPGGGATISIKFTDTILDGGVGATREAGCHAAGLCSGTVRIAVFVGLFDTKTVPTVGAAIEVLGANAVFHTAISTSGTLMGETTISF